MSYTACQLWPSALSMEAQIRFWLDSPEVPATKAEATREALPQMLQPRLVQSWLALTLFLGRIRGNSLRPTAKDVVAFCQELYETEQLTAEEVLSTRRKLYVCTLNEFEWHKERLRKVCQARYDEQMYCTHA